MVKNRDRKDIAKECGLTEAGLKSVLSKYGIKKPKFEIPVEEIEQLLKDGNSVEFIANKFNCGETSIYRIMKKHGLITNYKPDYKKYNNLSRTLTVLNGYKGLVSWTGTMFEYLMPNINIKQYESSLLDESSRFLIMSQMEYAKKLRYTMGNIRGGI